MESPQQPRQASPMGRALRILLGLVLMVYVAPVYFQVSARVSVGSLLLIVGLIGIYSLLHINYLETNPPVGFGAWRDCGEWVACDAVFYRCHWITHCRWRKGCVSSGHVCGYLIGGCGRARRSRLRSDGDPRSSVWKAHRAGVSHLFPAGQA